MYLKIRKLFEGWHEKKIVWLFLTSGFLLILAGLPKELWIFPILNALFETNIEVVDKINYILLGITMPIGMILIATGLWFYFKTRNKIKKLNMVQIRHSSIESVSFSKISSEMSDYNVEVYSLNQLEELKSANQSSLYHALREQEKVVQKILSRLDDSSDVVVSYFGLAHIPLIILLGYQMSDKSSVSFFEWNQNKLSWDEVQKSTKEFPRLLETREHHQSAEDTKEIIIKIGLTYPISNSDLMGLNLEGLNCYYLHLNPTHRNAIVSNEQLEAYKEQFRMLLDEINQSFPKLIRIHLFYSGQPSLAYRLGSAITQRMDKEIIVYNYVGSVYPKYNWAINLKKVDQPIKIKITGDELSGHV